MPFLPLTLIEVLQTPPPKKKKKKKRNSLFTKKIKLSRVSLWAFWIHCKNIFFLIQKTELKLALPKHLQYKKPERRNQVLISKNGVVFKSYKMSKTNTALSALSDAEE